MITRSDITFNVNKEFVVMPAEKNVRKDQYSAKVDEYKIGSSKETAVTIKNVREYPWFGRLFAWLGYAIKIDDKYYNCKSLVQRIACQLLDCPSGGESIKKTESLWQDALYFMGQQKTSDAFCSPINTSEHVSRIYERALEKVQEKVQEKCQQEALWKDPLYLKFKLLSKIRDSRETSFLYSLQSLTTEKYYTSHLSNLDLKQVVKEDWFKEQCCTKISASFLYSEEYAINRLFKKTKSVTGIYNDQRGRDNIFEFLAEVVRIVSEQDPGFKEDLVKNLNQNYLENKEFFNYIKQKFHF